MSTAFTVRDSGDTRLVGRDVELARLRGLLAPPHNESRLLLVVGDVGLGKTALLAEAVGRARASGMRILAAVGRESEQDLTFAGLHQLLHPVLDRVADLPARQAEALRGAFAISADPASPDSLLTGIAVLTLLCLLAKDGPVLVLADDVQWLDRASLDALAFAARRLDAEPAILLLAARGTEPPTRLERDFPGPVRLGPLSAAAAGRLLDAQPRPPRGRARQQVLAQAAGNPLALIELSKVIAADPDAGRRWAAEPLPLASRLTAVMTAQYADLPEATRHALLLAAAADSPDVTALAVPGLAARDLAPAEAAGLIRSGVRGPEFAHPLVRSAVYHAAPLADRAAAHLLIADSLRDQPDRYAWQLAAAALAPDEQVAALLEDTAVQAKRRGGTSAAARALERAAELSPSQRDQARRLLAAADLALPGGQAPGPRLAQLAARARGLLASGADAGAHFAPPLADPAGREWPFERAQLQLDYGEWLRRQRRINDAKPVLGAALTNFRRLGAGSWTARAEAELRACGVVAQASPVGHDALSGLTTQQREIVRLAGTGLTNSEIADRLFLSPRTVASHLYRSYPKLGVAGRHQLRDLTEPDEA